MRTALLVLLLSVSAAPARAAFDGMRYRLEAGNLVGENPECRLKVSNVRKFEVNGHFALTGNVFPYSVFYLETVADARGTRTRLRGLLGMTYLRDTRTPCRALSVTIAEDVTDFRPLRRPGPSWDFGAQYEVDLAPGAPALLPKDFDAAVAAGTAELNRLLDAER
ncbi:MAG: hypothetical protein HY079_07500 [Elusimicrobia bacterium]|nr:hypothetical protein [Elusimicrobiota bacterium]